jgi:hypothetical protein
LKNIDGKLYRTKVKRKKQAKLKTFPGIVGNKSSNGDDIEAMAISMSRGETRGPGLKLVI